MEVSYYHKNINAVMINRYNSFLEIMKDVDRRSCFGTNRVFDKRNSLTFIFQIKEI